MSYPEEEPLTNAGKIGLLCVVAYMLGMVITFGHAARHTRSVEVALCATAFWPFYVSYRLFDPHPPAYVDRSCPAAPSTLPAEKAAQ